MSAPSSTEEAVTALTDYTVEALYICWHDLVSETAAQFPEISNVLQESSLYL